jgi:hypothetical protein
MHENGSRYTQDPQGGLENRSPGPAREEGHGAGPGPGPKAGSSPGRWVSFREACLLLAISDKTLRKRIAAGVVHGRQEGGPHGPEWRIWLPLEAEEAPPDPPGPVREEPGMAVRDQSGPEGHEPELLPPAVSESQARAFRELLERHEQLTFRVGYLEGRLEEQRPMLEAGEVARARAESLAGDLAAAATQAAAAEREAQETAAQASAVQARLQGRVRIWAAVAAILALLSAMMGGLLLGRPATPGRATGAVSTPREAGPLPLGAVDGGLYGPAAARSHPARRDTGSDPARPAPPRSTAPAGAGGPPPQAGRPSRQAPGR